MLVRLYGENFHSFRDPFELSMVAADLTNVKDQDRGVVKVELEGADEPLTLLRTAAIFGPNASGKSSLLKAAKALSWLIEYSSQKSKPEKKIPPYEPFLLNEHSDSQPICLGCTITFGKKLLEYEVQYTSTEFVSERLVEFGSEEKVLLDRQQGKKIVGELIEISEANKLYVQEMQPNVAVLSKLAQHGPSQGEGAVKEYFDAILKSLLHKSYMHNSPRGRPFFDSTAKRLHTDEDFNEWVMSNLICASDVGIVGVKTSIEKVPDEVKEAISEITEESVPDTFYKLGFVHSGESDKDKDKELDFGDESEGTRKMYGLASDWWNLAHTGVSLFADEISASLHPRLLDALVRAVSNPENTAQKSQLIFSTHDVGLLEGRDGLPAALRRDQVYFTEKNAEGASSLYSLAEFKDQARGNGVHNLRKRYLEGRYGALPMPDGIRL